MTVARSGDIAPPGHAVVRVGPGGGSFRIFTLSTADESMTVLFERTFLSNPEIPH